MKYWVRTFLLLLLLGAATPSRAQNNVSARLILSLQEAQPGDTVTAGILLKLNPGWHVYWKNSGDSGIPTKIDWQLPEGVTAGETEWPVPDKEIAEGLTTYNYAGETLLRVPLKLAKTLPASTLQLQANVSWLECNSSNCIPGSNTVTAVLAVGKASKASADADVFSANSVRLPRTAPAFAVKAYWEKDTTEDSRPVIVEFPSQANVAAWDFYPHPDKSFEVDGTVTNASPDNKTYRFRKLIKKSGDKWPEQLNGLLVGGKTAERPDFGYEVKLPIGVATVASANVAETGQEKPPAKSLLGILGLAFLGGLILNIMPCVLPVIALKILGFVNQSKEAPGRVRQLGLIYGLGVLVSFLVLAGMVIGVQQAGRLASWGMQFQNPQFLVAITVLVLLVTLNLFGVFEVTLGGSAMGAAGQLASRHGASGAFFNGVLATALATPCTAPFLGVALGFAFSQPPAIIVLVFLTVGLGLAFPYVILSWQPKWLKFLPKPGAWMEKFKIAMGFPMIATALWLFSLAAPNFGKNGTFWLAMLLVILALAMWVWGEFVQRGSKRKGLAWGIVIALLVFNYSYILEGQLRWRSPEPIQAGGSGNLQESPDGIAWKAWSPAAVKEARNAGKVVFVDFTADWCVTCQGNKKTSIEIDSVRKKLKEIGAVSLLADYTHESAEITAELQHYGRAGVPLVIVYPKDASKPAIVLPELLTPGIVLDALDQAAH